MKGPDTLATPEFARFGFGQICCRDGADQAELLVLESEDLIIKPSGKNFRDTLIDFAEGRSRK
jgi:hypothetical protein